MGTVTTNTEYDSGIEYDNYVDNTSNITFIQTSEGRARKGTTKYVFEYDLKDHLGNTRVTVSPDPADATEKTPKILQEDNYYAFGYTIQSTEDITNPKNEYLYNGKELQEETGLYDYGARFYDPLIGRWITLDPLSDLFSNKTSYNYAQNNPVLMIDPLGMSSDTGATVTPTGIIGPTMIVTATPIYGYGTFGFAGWSNWRLGNNVRSFTYADMRFTTVRRFNPNRKINGFDLNPNTVGHNYFGSVYIGPNNPMSYNGLKYYYNVPPTGFSDIAAMMHDLDYDNIGATGINGVLNNTDAIGADYKLVARSLNVATNTSNPASPGDRITGLAVALGIGLASFPKTFSYYESGIFIKAGTNMLNSISQGFSNLVNQTSQGLNTYNNDFSHW